MRLRSRGFYMEIDLKKLNFAFAALVLVSGVPNAKADDSGYVSINSFNS